MKFVLAAILLPAFPVIAQTTSTTPTTTGPAQTRGTCSPANTGNRNTFTIKCGIGEQQGKEMIVILNKILASQTDTAFIANKLDQILHELNPNYPQISYTEDGYERTSRPGEGQFSMEEGANPVLLQFKNLEKRGDWAGILKLSNEQISLRPDWFTPYDWAAAANANLGNFAEAKRLALYAKEHIAGNQDYVHLDADLDKLLANLPK